MLPRDVDPAVKGHGDADGGARPVRAVGHRRGDAGYGRRRKPDQLDAVARGRHGRVRAGAQGKGVDGKRAAEPVKAAGAVGRRAGRREGAVFVHPDQLDAVARMGCDQRVRGVAHFKGVHAARPVEHGKVAAGGRRAPCLHGAVPVDADQLDAGVAVRGGDDGMRGAAHFKGVHVAGVLEALKAVVPVPYGPVCRQDAVAACAKQLDGAGLEQRGDDVRAAAAAARLEGVDVVGCRVAEGVAVRRRAGRREGAVFVHADQLDAGVVVGGHRGVRAAAQGKGVDAPGAVEPGERAAPAVVDRRGARLREGGAVFVHPDQLDGVAWRGGHHGVRAVARDGNANVAGAGDAVEPAAAAAAGRRRGGCDQRRRRMVDQDVARPGQRSRRAGRGQGQAGGVARHVGDVARQGCRAVVVQAGGAVPEPHRIGKYQRLRAVAVLVRGRPRGPADVEDQHGVGARVRDALVELDGYADLQALAVRAVRGGDRHDRRRPCIDGNVRQVAERPSGSGGRQGAAGLHAGCRVHDRAAAARQGVNAGIVEAVRLLAVLHLVAELQRVGVVAADVLGRAARVEMQHRRPRDADLAVKGHADHDFGAPLVRAAGGLRADAGYGRRRQLDQLDRIAVERGRKRVRPVAHGKGADAAGAVQPAKAGRAAAAAGRRAGREQGAVAVAHADQLHGVVRARGDRGVRGAVDRAEDVDAARLVEAVEPGRAVVGRSRGLEGAVFVHADQLHGVLELGGDQGVRAVAQGERGNLPRAGEPQLRAVAVVERSAGLQGAVFVHADQLHAGVAVPADQGVRAVAQAEHVDVERVPKLQVAGLIVQRLRAPRLQPGVVVHADQLHAVVAKRGDQGVRVAAHLKGRHAGGLGEVAGDVVHQPARRREGAAFVHPDQLHAPIPAGGDEGVRAAVQGKGVDAPGIEEPGVRAVAGLRRRLHAAVVVHPDQLHGVVGRAADQGMREAAHVKGGYVPGPVERFKAAQAVAGRAGRDHPRNGGVDEHVARSRKRAGRAGGRQRQVGGVARNVRDASGQGLPPRIVEVVGAVAGLRRVREQEVPRARSRDVRRGAAGLARIQRQRGRRARHRVADLHGL